jgi:hypothetical protein
VELDFDLCQALKQTVTEFGFEIPKRDDRQSPVADRRLVRGC